MTGGLLAPSHIIMLGLIALLVFGPKRLPEIGRSFGHGLRGFKDSVAGDEEKSVAQIETAAPAPVAFAQPEPAVTAEPRPGPAEQVEHERIPA
jgi:sec-independent protein translocase protein TatA